MPCAAKSGPTASYLKHPVCRSLPASGAGLSLDYEAPDSVTSDWPGPVCECCRAAQIVHEFWNWPRPPAAYENLGMSRFRILFSSFWFKLSLSAGLLVLLIHQANLTALWRTVIDANAGWLLVALAAYGGSQVLTALRWALLARPFRFQRTGEPLCRVLL